MTGATPALLLLAGAVAALPGSPARMRIGSDAPGSWAQRPTRPATVVIAAVVLGVPVLVITGLWAVGAGLAVAAATALHVRQRRMESARVWEDDGHIVAALEIAAAELRAGAHPGSACAVAARHTPEGAVARRLSAAAAQAQLGGSVSRALAAGDAAAWRRIAAVWAVAETRGIALARLLEVARRDVTGRASLRRRAEASLAGARSTALVLAVLPVLGIGFGHLMGAAPLRVLTGGGLGSVLLVAGVLLDCVGLVWAERIMSGTAR